MKKILASMLSIISVTASFVPVIKAEGITEIHVAVNGFANGDGSEQNPVNSFEKAAELAKVNGGENIVVKFHEGEYPVKGTIKLGEGNSGSAKGSLIYTAYEDDEVVFTGASKLNPEGFKPVSDPIMLKKIPQSARTKVLVYNLSGDGIFYSLKDEVRPYLYVNDNLKTTARYPDSEHVRAVLANGTTSFEFNDYDVSRWEGAKDAVLCGSLESTYFWHNTDISVSSNVITAKGCKIRNNAEFWVENLIEELDVPGEYFVDREANMLYYYPSESLENAKIEITTNFDDVINMNNVLNVTFDRLKFDKIGGSAFHIENAKNVNIKNCVINYSQGENAIYFKGNDSEISDNSFYGCANNVIEFHGGSVKTLTKGNVHVKNNRISMCGFYEKNSIIKSGSSATSLPNDFGNRISNNLIQDCTTFMGIVVNANDCLIDHNEIVNPGYLIGDGGAIYMGRSNTKHGMEVSYNYIHDGRKDDADYFYCGIYSDDGYGGSYFHHNVVANMYQGMIMNAGMNCRFNNNLLINNSATSGGMSIMSSYTPEGGAVESGYQALFFNETDKVLNKTIWGATYASNYPYLVETLNRKPYFAAWDSEVVGNVSIGCNGKGVKLDLWHPCYKKDGVTPVIEGENLELAKEKGAYYYAERYKGKNLIKGYIIDEFMLYGKEILNENGEELNNTELGNPILDYNAAYFRDPENQDYTLTDVFSSDVSTVNEIDMEEIGLLKSSNPVIYSDEAKKVILFAPTNGAENLYGEKVKFLWERVRDASKYRIVIAEDEGLNDIIIDETFIDSSDALVREYNLEKGKTYYWQVTATGLARLDSFEVKSDIYSFKTCNEDVWNKENVNLVITLLESKIKDYNDGIIEYSDESMHDEIVSLAERGNSIIKNSTAQTEFDEYEEDVLNTLIDLEGYITMINPDITECYAEQNSDMVYVKGAGFKKNSMITVMVTNPGATLDTAEEKQDLTQIQFIDTILSDDSGNVEFSFKTRFDGRDRSGEYTVYVKNNFGKSVTKTYNYGTVYAEDIKYKNAYGQEITDLSSCKGEEISMSCTIHNDMKTGIYPAIVTAFYDNNKLVGVVVDDKQTVEAGSVKELTWKATVNTEGITMAKVLFVDSLLTLKPLMRYRVIYEKTVD